MFLKIKSLFQLFQESFGPILEQIRNFPTSASSESMLPQSNPKNWIKTPTNSSKVRFEVSIKILRVRHSALLALFASIYSSSTLLNSCWLCYLLKSLKNTIKVSLVRNASNFSINQQQADAVYLLDHQNEMLCGLKSSSQKFSKKSKMCSVSDLVNLLPILNGMVESFHLQIEIS